MDDPVIDKAKLLHKQLLDTAQEFRYKINRSNSFAAMDLAKHDAEVCEAASKMLRKLSLEVTRLRLGIGHYQYGRLSRADLINLTENWND